MRGLSTRIAMGLAVVGSALAPTAVRAAEEERVLDRTALEGGGVLSVSVMSGTHLAVRTEGGKGLRLEAQPVTDLFPRGEIVAAKAASRKKGDVVLAVVVRGPGGEPRRDARAAAHSYHWVTTTGGKDGSWLVSEPLFRDDGAPFRVVEVRSPEGDAIEITFRRGSPDPRAGARPVEEKVYVHSGPADPKVGVAGRDRLVSSVLGSTGPLLEEKIVEEEIVDSEIAETEIVEADEPMPSDVPPDAPVVEAPVAKTPSDLGPPPATIVVTLARDGGLEATDAMGIRTSVAAGAPRTAVLEKALASAFSKPEWRAGDRLSRVALEVRADPEVPWTGVEEVLRAAAAAHVHRVRIGEVGGTEALDVPLPVDRGIPPRGRAPALPAGVEVSISPFRMDGGSVPVRGITVRVDEAEILLLDTAASPARGDALAKVRAALAAAKGRGAAYVELSLRAPADVRFKDVLAVVGVARGAGFTDVRFGRGKDR